MGRDLLRQHAGRFAGRTLANSGPVDPHPFASRLDHAWRARDSGIVTRGGAVQTWPDPYNGLTVSQGTSGNRPTHSTSDADFGATRGQSVTPDGTDDYLVSSGNVVSRSSCAYGVIFKAGATGALRTIFSSGVNMGAGGVDIRITASGNLIFICWDAAGQQSGLFSSVTAGNVYRAFANWNPVVGTYGWTMWLNAVSTGTVNGQTILTPTNQTGVARLFANSAPGQFFNGKGERVEKFNGNFTAPEIAILDAYYLSELT